MTTRNESFPCTLTTKLRAQLDAALSRSDHKRLLELGCEQAEDDGEYELWKPTQRYGEFVLMWSSRL